MSVVSVLTKGNKARIPDAVVEVLGLKPSSPLVFDIEGGSVKLTAKTATFADLAGTFAKRKRSKTATIKEMRTAIRKGAARRFQGSAS